MTATPSPTTARTSDHLAPLDGLRGIAIALVVWYHIWQITWLRADVHLGAATLNFNAIPETGFVGVDLFFFISGFVLFYPYARARFDGRPVPTLREFVARRATKILPSYYLSLVVFIALGWVHFASPGDAFAQIAAHALFVHIFWGSTWGGINGVLWSLAVEVQFYVLFPLVVWCAVRRPLPTFAALAAIGLGYRALVHADFDAVHEIDRLPGTIDLFAYGMTCAYVYRAVATRAQKLARRRPLWTAVAVGGLAAGALTIRGAFDARLADGWPMHWDVLGRTELGLSFFALALGTLFAIPLWYRVLGNPALTFLGFVSYNLYLYHQQIARSLLEAHLPPWQGASEHGDPAWGIAFSGVATVVAIGVAWALTTFFEQPLMRCRARARGLTPTLTPERV